MSQRLSGKMKLLRRYLQSHDPTSIDVSTKSGSSGELFSNETDAPTGRAGESL
jgi:hypothetical protein